MALRADEASPAEAPVCSSSRSSAKLEKSQEIEEVPELKLPGKDAPKIRRGRQAASDQDIEDFLDVFFDEADEDVLNAEADEPEWIEVDVAADSGAGDNVAKREDAPGYEVKESEGSKRGQNFISASKTRIANEGEVHLQMAAPTGTDGEFNPVNAVFQVADVCRPLMSVSRICDRGENTVTFDKNKAVVRNKRGQIVMTFVRKGNLYVGRMRVRNPKHKLFGRQGS